MGAGEKAGTWVVRYDSGIGPRYYVGPWASGGVQYTSERDHAKVFDSLAEARERARAASSKVYRVKPRAPEAFGDEVGPQHREQLEALAASFDAKAAKADAGYQHGEKSNNTHMAQQCKGERDAWAEAARMVREASPAPTKKGS
jgi:hypothetical protein